MLIDNEGSSFIVEWGSFAMQCGIITCRVGKLSEEYLTFSREDEVMKL